VENVLEQDRQVTHLADVPLFADSRASRLIQPADLIAYGPWRSYGPDTSDASLASLLRSRFDQADGVMHGVVHVWKGYRRTEEEEQAELRGGSVWLVVTLAFLLFGLLLIIEGLRG